MPLALPDRPDSSIQKFNADGSIRRFPGNTILCRIGSGNPGFGTIESIRNALRHEGFAEKFVFLPSSSFHMTVFDGAQPLRRDDGLWPAAMPAGPLGEVHARFAEKLAGFDAPSGFRMKPKDLVLDPLRGSIIRLEPGDHAERRRLRVLRDRLSDLLAIREPVHADYVFHITLSYLVRPLDAGEAKAVAKAHGALTVHLSRALSMLELGWPEFCTFENMLYFERQFFLGAAGR